MRTQSKSLFVRLFATCFHDFGRRCLKVGNGVLFSVHLDMDSVTNEVFRLSVFGLSSWREQVVSATTAKGVLGYKRSISS